MVGLPAADSNVSGERDARVAAERWASVWKAAWEARDTWNQADGRRQPPERWGA
jgi:hypothetical protein